MAAIAEDRNVTAGATGSVSVRTQQRQRRVALLTNIPAPYRLEMFRLLGERCDLKVFFDGRSEPNRSWQLPGKLPFSHEYLQSAVIPYWRKRPDNGVRERRYYQMSSRTYFALRRFAPDVVISGEMGFRTLQASLYTSLHGVPLIIWSEGTPHTEGWATAKQRVRRFLAQRASRFWSNGSESSELLTHYGARSENIDQPMIGTDTRRHWMQVQTARAGRDALRSKLELAGTVFLFAGRFHNSKGIPQLLKAFERLTKLTPRSFSAVFIGDGPEKPALETWKNEHPEVRMQIVGFLQPEELFPFYAACDVLVLPTLEDNWSLVALEAAAAGMPQVFSKFNGASRDLQSLQAPGVCVDPTDIESFAQALIAYTENPPACSPDSTTERIVTMFSSESWVARACDSIEAAVGSRRCA